MSETTAAVALLVLRSAIGVVFVAHGAKHFANRAKTIAWTESIGFQRPRVQWFFMTFAEIAIGLGFLAGLLTSVAAAGVAAMMLVAFWTVHRHAGFFVSARPDEGYEYVLVLTLVALAVAVAGPGDWSVDHLIGFADHLDGLAGALVVLAGVMAGVLQLALFFRPADVS